MSWISETFFQIVSWIPNWLYADDSPRYLIVRSLLGLILILIVIVVIAFWRGRTQRRSQDHTRGRN